MDPINQATAQVDDVWVQVRNTVVEPIFALLLITALVLLALWLVRFLLGRVETRLAHADGDYERATRLRTLLNVGKHTADTVIVGLGIAMGLLTVGINIAPALAAAGVVGLGISLGAQTLIKDFLGGLIILAEDQFRVGDEIEVGAITGTVERINLRATTMRDVRGRLITVPNGDVRTVANLSRDWSRAIIDLNVSLDSDVGQVVGALERAVTKATEDPELKERILGTPEILGWNSFNDWAIQVRLMVKTRPGDQARVGRTLRQHALDALNAAGVRLAVPTQDLRTTGVDGGPSPAV